MEHLSRAINSIVLNPLQLPQPSSMRSKPRGLQPAVTQEEKPGGAAAAAAGLTGEAGGGHATVDQ